MTLEDHARILAGKVTHGELGMREAAWMLHKRSCGRLTEDEALRMIRKVR